MCCVCVLQTRGSGGIMKNDLMRKKVLLHTLLAVYRASKQSHSWLPYVFPAGWSKSPITWCCVLGNKLRKYELDKAIGGWRQKRREQSVAPAVRSPVIIWQTLPLLPEPRINTYCKHIV